MAPADMSTGRMVSYAYERALGRSEAGSAERRTRREKLARRMLEYVLMNGKARRVMLDRVVGITTECGEPRTHMRLSGLAFDLVAPLSTNDDGRALLGIVTKIDGVIDPERMRLRLEALGHHPQSRLLVIAPRSRKKQLAEIGEDPRLVTTTWARLVRRTAMKDPKRAALWQLLGEFCEDAGPLAVHTPSSPRVLLDEEVVGAFRAHLDSMRLAAEVLFGRAAKFSTARSSAGARLSVGSPGKPALEFGAVESGTPLWLAAGRPRVERPLGIGALDDTTREQARAGLAELAADPTWREDVADLPEHPALIGERALPGVEHARALLWEVFDPSRLAAAGFPLVARQQPEWDGTRLAVRVEYPADPAAGTFLVSIGGSSTWRTLLPRVTREFDGRTYIIQAPKSATGEDLVRDVHAGLMSLATKP